MKLLLTSAGITNKSIASTLFDLVGKKPEDTTLVFIPTASNVEIGDKEWLIDNLIQLKELGLKEITITDISAVSEDIWRPQLEKADILFFEGGNTYHLMRCIEKSGLKEILPELLKTKVWVGASAGSMVTNKDLQLKTSQIIYGEDLAETENMPGLNYVDFYFLPHLNSDYFTKLRKENIEKAIEGIREKVYCMDDEGAIKVVDRKIEIITEGEYLEFN
jgi:dipeptidase E